MGNKTTKQEAKKKETRRMDPAIMIGDDQMTSFDNPIIQQLTAVISGMVTTLCKNMQKINECVNTGATHPLLDFCPDIEQTQDHVEEYKEYHNRVVNMINQNCISGGAVDKFVANYDILIEQCYDCDDDTDIESRVELQSLMAKESASYEEGAAKFLIALYCSAMYDMNNNARRNSKLLFADPDIDTTPGFIPPIVVDSYDTPFTIDGSEFNYTLYRIITGIVVSTIRSTVDDSNGDCYGIAIHDFGIAALRVMKREQFDQFFINGGINMTAINVLTNQLGILFDYIMNSLCYIKIPSVKRFKPYCQDISYAMATPVQMETIGRIDERYDQLGFIAMVNIVRVAAIVSTDNVGDIASLNEPIQKLIRALSKSDSNTITYVWNNMLPIVSNMRDFEYIRFHRCSGSNSQKTIYELNCNLDVIYTGHMRPFDIKQTRAVAHSHHINKFKFIDVNRLTELLEYLNLGYLYKTIGYTTILEYEILLTLGIDYEMQLPPRDINNMCEFITTALHVNSTILRDIGRLVDLCGPNKSILYPKYDTVPSAIRSTKMDVCHMYNYANPDVYVMMLLWLSKTSLLNATRILNVLIHEAGNRNLDLRKILTEYEPSELIKRDAVIEIP